MGSPGCGKTTTATAVGHRLGMSVVDVDDYLENFWKTPVSTKVHCIDSSVIQLTMQSKTMQSLGENGCQS